MKKSKKILAALLAGVMVLGTGLVAFAENGSPSVGGGDWDDGDYYVWTYKDYFEDQTVSIAGGTGTIAEITTPKMQDLVIERMQTVWNYIYNHCKDANGDEITFFAEYSFDLQGVSGGEVSVKLGDLGYAAKEMEKQGNKLVAYVSHYNETKKEWEHCWSEVKMDGSNGLVTFKFDTYSPILIQITNAATEDDEAVSAISYNENPVQTVATAPKTEDATAAWLVLFGAAVVAVAVSRKKLFA